MSAIVNTVVPIAVCVVLPVTVVWITSRMKIMSDKLRTEVLIKAIESNKDVDADKLAEALARPAKTERDVLFTRLKRGVMFSIVAVLLTALIVWFSLIDWNWEILAYLSVVAYAIGIANLVTYFVSKPHVLGEENKPEE